jgi:hypothetical protein
VTLSAEALRAWVPAGAVRVPGTPYDAWCQGVPPPTSIGGGHPAPTSSRSASSVSRCVIAAPLAADWRPTSGAALPESSKLALCSDVEASEGERAARAGDRAFRRAAIHGVSEYIACDGDMTRCASNDCAGLVRSRIPNSSETRADAPGNRVQVRRARRESGRRGRKSLLALARGRQASAFQPRLQPRGQSPLAKHIPARGARVVFSQKTSSALSHVGAARHAGWSGVAQSLQARPGVACGDVPHPLLLVQGMHHRRAWRASDFLQRGGGAVALPRTAGTSAPRSMWRVLTGAS